MVRESSVRRMMERRSGDDVRLVSLSLQSLGHDTIPVFDTHEGKRERSLGTWKLQGPGPYSGVFGVC